MPNSFSPELLSTFRAMAAVVYAGESFETVYESLCNAAVELVDGCDHASLMLRQHGRVSTVAASDEISRVVDTLEQETGEGPCIDAIDDDRPDQHICTDLSTGCEWPELARLIRERTVVRGMAGFRIRLDGQKVGALNLFSDRADSLDATSLDQALMLTSFASVTLAAVQRGQEATTLRRGLESNREIGKAIGMLMAVHGIDDEQAFDMLAKVSQEMNIKLAQVAARVIAHHRAEAGGTPG